MSLAVQNTPALNGINGTSMEQKKYMSKNQLRRQKAKQKKATAQVRASPVLSTPPFPFTKSRWDKAPKASEKEERDKQEPENIEYVSEQLDLKGAALEAFSDVFARFQFQPEDIPVRKIII
jgi:splicing factor 3B subunit 2